MFRSLTYGEVLQPIVTEVEQQIKQIHEKIDERIDSNQFRVLKSFQNYQGQ